MNAYESDYAVVECSWKVQGCVKDRARVREAVYTEFGVSTRCGENICTW